MYPSVVHDKSKRLMYDNQIRQIQDTDTTTEDVGNPDRSYYTLHSLGICIV